MEGRFSRTNAFVRTDIVGRYLIGVTETRHSLWSGVVDFIVVVVGGSGRFVRDCVFIFDLCMTPVNRLMRRASNGEWNIVFEVVAWRFYPVIRNEGRKTIIEKVPSTIFRLARLRSDKPTSTNQQSAVAQFPSWFYLFFLQSVNHNHTVQLNHSVIMSVMGSVDWNHNLRVCHIHDAANINHLLSYRWTRFKPYDGRNRAIAVDLNRNKNRIYLLTAST